MGILVDSGVFIRWEREGRGLDLSTWTSIGEPFMSVVTVSELKVGVHRANSSERTAKRNRFVATVLSCVTVLDIDSAVAEIHARIVADLTTKGTMIGPHDFWIAATALKYDYDLLTTNTGEFQRVPNLRVIDYPNSN
jgi:tRNA(fMet)-specific endonuclease VapC